MKNPILDSTSLCFNKDEFFKDNFAVDGFVQRYRQQAGLEALRNDLGMYLKLLRSSMIDLINRDYADFVNLSSNLVGLDASIGRLVTPLGQLRCEVLSVRECFDELLDGTTAGLAELHRVRAQKQYLRRLGALPRYLERLEALCQPQTDQSSSEQDYDSMDRAAVEYNQLQYCVAHCRTSALVAQLQPRVQLVTHRLSVRLEDMLLAALHTDKHEQLTRALRVFAALDQASVAERLFRQHLVEPRMDELLSSAALKDSPRGLRGLLDAVLQFVTAGTHCSMVAAVTRRTDDATKNSAGGCLSRQYDFLVNSVWPVIAQKLSDDLSTIFAPGNPNTFYERYSASMEFVDRFEMACGSRDSVQKLRQDAGMKSFLQRWNLPVYYQIRFQEIGVCVEQTLVVDPTDSSVGTAVWNCVLRCWAPGVFLRPLTHRFWQLTLQILSRYRTAVIQQLDSPDKTDGGVSVQRCVCMLSDVRTLVDLCGSLLDQHVLPVLPAISDEAVHSMRDSLSLGVSDLEALTPRLTDHYTTALMRDVSGWMRAAGDIPRLYRRTNRDPPTSASSYVVAMLQPLQTFRQTLTQADVPQPTATDHIRHVAGKLCTAYTVHVDGVLTSVQRMEESLRRLKRSRPAATGSSSSSGSDDDKIRRQLQLDVQQLGLMLAELLLERSCQLPEFLMLQEMVDAASSANASSSAAV